MKQNNFKMIKIYFFIVQEHYSHGAAYTFHLINSVQNITKLKHSDYIFNQNIKHIHQGLKNSQKQYMD